MEMMWKYNVDEYWETYMWMNIFSIGICHDDVHTVMAMATSYNW
jgi:hypothetical protein